MSLIHTMSKLATVISFLMMAGTVSANDSIPQNWFWDDAGYKAADAAAP
jgi:hypothetical protein